MNNFIYENKTKVYFGQGCVKEFLTCLVRDYDTVMMAYGQGSIKKNGIYDEILNILMKEDKNVVEFPGIMPNPTFRKVMEGVHTMRNSGAEMILGIGGGSVMDCCKAISIAARCSGNAWENFWERRGIIDFEPVPLGVVVTTAGTGSECNGAAVITNEEKKIKTGHDYPACNPRFALIDPAYTFSVPQEQMISGAFDSLSHMMETYFSEPDEQNVSDEIAEALMRSVIKSIRLARQNPEDYMARSNLLWDSALSENRLIKLGKKCDFACHLMAHQIGAYTDCSHGQSVAVLHPVYYRHIYKDGVRKFARFAEHVWGIPADGRTEKEMAVAGVEALADFIREIGLPTTLRELGIKGKKDLEVSAIGLGCMGMSHAYGPAADKKEMTELLAQAVDKGYTFFDTAEVYGTPDNPHDNEEFLGVALKPYRSRIVLASKCGIRFDESSTAVNKPLIPDGRPETIKASIDGSLKRLQTDHLDLYYIHRIDRTVPIEETAGAMKDLIDAGKITHWGISEADEETLRRAHAVCPVTAVQNRYSMMYRDYEALFPVLEELQIGFVAFSPLANGFLTAKYDKNSKFEKGTDYRSAMPQFTPDAIDRNQEMIHYLKEMADRKDATPAQISLAWMLAKKPWIVPIPGTRKYGRLIENAQAADVELTEQEVKDLDQMLDTVPMSEVFGGSRIERNKK